MGEDGEVGEGFFSNGLKPRPAAVAVREIKDKKIAKNMCIA